MSRHKRIILPGFDVQIEVYYEEHPHARGIGLIAHPHPLMGGTADNKVVTTLARALHLLGCHTYRPNFRGVGDTLGSHDHGKSETDDLHAVLDYARGKHGRNLPVYLAGFSFGAYVITRLAKRLAEANSPARRLILVGTAAGEVGGLRHYATEAVTQDSIIIHGAKDETVPLENVLSWAEPLQLAIQIIPGADHFFHRKLHIIRHIVESAWRE